MNTLIQLLHSALGTGFALYIQTQGFHWNVRGPIFHQAHALFGEQYTEQWNALDALAEQVRALDETVDQRIDVLLSQSNYKLVSYTGQSFDEMLTLLIEGHDHMIALYNAAMDSAIQCEEQGVANFIGGRIEAHQKQRWMLVASK